MTIAVLSLILGTVGCKGDDRKAEIGRGDVEINRTNFPDGFFREFVSENYDLNSDGVLSASERQTVEHMDVSHKKIASLEGIKYFKALKTLDCLGNSLSELNLRNNPALVKLDCSFNALSSKLDVSENPALTELSCSYNELIAY